MKSRSGILNAFLFAWVFAAVFASYVAQSAELNQAAWIENSSTYRFGHNSIPTIAIRNAPHDIDWRRWAMLHDGAVYRLYFFKQGSNDTLYQFGFNTRTSSYEYGHQSIPMLRIQGVPTSADASDIAMLHDGSVYRLYMQDRHNRRILYQFGFNPQTQNYEYGHRSIPMLQVTGFPADTDWNRWAMLHDGSAFRFYAFRTGSNSSFYQASFHAPSQEYRYSFQSIPVMTLQQIPSGANTTTAAMLHDGLNFRFYFQGR